MTMADSICECCLRKRELVGVCSSTIGPISFAICRECLILNAEPVFLCEGIVEMLDGENLEPTFWNMIVFDQSSGRYKTFGEIKNRKAG